LLVAGLVAYGHAALATPWQINAGGYYLNPRLSQAALPGSPGGLDATSDLKAGLSLTAHLSDQFALEACISPPFQIDLVATGAAAPLGVVGQLDSWGPLLVAQWRPGRDSWPIRPVLGVGAVYAIFLDETASATLNGAAGGPVDIRVDDAWSLVWQLGAEFRLTDHWRGVLSATFAAPDTEATFAGPAGAATTDLEIEAWLIGLGVGYRF